MRLWHYKLIEVLPNKMLVAQWRECIAIKRQIEKETLKHRLVSYVLNYDGIVFYDYVLQVIYEMKRRKLKYKESLLREIADFCCDNPEDNILSYPEHNNRYLKQCYYNLQEKYDRRNYYR